jgi:hypothetical protein
LAKLAENLAKSWHLFEQDKAALLLYTEAVFAAPTHTEEGRREVALGLANRSAVWFKGRESKKNKTENWKAAKSHLV